MLYKDDKAEKEDKEKLREIVYILDIKQERIDATTKDLMIPLPWNNPEVHEHNQDDVDAQLHKEMHAHEYKQYPTPEPSIAG